ncbi:MAG: hypothetical protein CVV51_14700 [Spirochaetae bacterium HGW-Spirochaetae-7]|jgi:hypothetical protein|nr:MAG: hypothetical protein CVV51_14700 [Spirochaetae bacterium HGW-Spirochaetae-7]
MKRNLTATIAAILIVFASAQAFAQPQVSEKKEIAIFSLGFYGWDIPLETLGTIDIDIQRVFLDLGRFTIFGMEKRFSTGAVDEFITILKKMKESTFVLPEKYQFGEAFLTEADFNKLVGAFIIAVPVVTSYNSQYVDNKEWRTNIKTNVSFIDVADGTMIGIANVETQGTSRETQYKSIRDAIAGIPMQLQFEIRKVPQFQNVTRVLASGAGGVDLQLGSNMGIKKGDEYAIIESDNLEGFVDEREVGLIVIKQVGTTRSKGTILFSKVPVVKDVQLREIPRLGADIAVYAHSYNYIDGGVDLKSSFVIGARAEMTRGFYELRPYIAIQAITDTSMWLPINAIIGGEYSVFLRRLEFGARAGLAGSTNAIIRLIEDKVSNSDDPWFTHYGLSGGAYLSYLFSRDLKIFAEVQADYMLGIADSIIGGAFGNYGGYQIGIGATFKL